MANLAVLVTAFALIVAELANAQICPINLCTDQTQTCFTRNVSGQPDFICECNTAFRVGHNCQVITDNQETFTCYGTNCVAGRFSSVGYPNDYPVRYIAVYLLYIPGATEIIFEFDSPFGLEVNKDELYIGRGVQPDVNTLNRVSREEDNLYFFEGYTRPPGTYSIFSDTAFLYFLTDKNIHFEGFQVRWSIGDNVPPTITCPSLPDQLVTQEGATGTVVFWNTPTASDNTATSPTVEPFPSTQQGPNSFFSFGFHSITYRATDAAGNSNTCAVTFNVVDRVIPQFSNCPSDITRQANFNQNFLIVNWVVPTATDNAPGQIDVVRTSGPDSGSSFTTGQTTTVTYVARDVANNAATCSFTVTITQQVDNVPPTITCPSLPDQLVTQEGATGALVFWNTPTASDNSGINPTVELFPSTQQGPNSFFSFDSHSITYRATDAAGNTNACAVTFNVVDRVIPQFSNCPSDITRQANFNQNFLIVNWVVPTATDNAPGQIDVVRTSGPDSGSSFTTGQTTTVTYVARDVANNVATCSFTVTITQQADNIAPMFTRCPDNIAQPFEIDGITTSAVVNWLPPLATDNSGGTVQIIQTLGPQSGSLFTIGQTTIITYQATDPTGNTATCSFSVRVVPVDTAAPVFTSCPQDITRSIPFGSTFVTVNWNLPAATDNSGSPPSIVNQSRNPGQFTQGTYNIRYTATDGSNNVAECTFTLTINQQADNIAPMFTRCPDNIAQPFEIDGITTSAVVNWLPPLATDNSGGTVQIIQTLGPQSGSLFTIGQTTTITYQATDPTGNTATCSFSVRVVPVDSAAPVFTSCPRDITQSIPFGSTFVTVNWNLPTATDNSGSPPSIVNQSRNPGQFTQGTYNIRYTATDGSNNVAECTFTITVNQGADTTPPVFTSCPQDFTQTIPFGSTFVAVNWNTPTATDNSGSPPNIVNQSRNPGQFTQGTYNIRYTATDGSNNVAECTFTVTVNQEADTTPPVFTSCPQDFTQTIPFGSTFVAVNWNMPTATDNSGSPPNIVNQSRNPGQFTLGTYNIRYTATDGSNNVAECTFTVTVNQGADTTPPVFTSCPQDFTQTIPFGSTFVAVNWNTPTATDNSGSPPNIVNQSRNPGQFTQGTYNIRYTATDGSNNVAECTFTVTVNQEADTTPPVFTSCPQDFTQSIPFGSTFVAVNWNTPTATDNSGSPPNIVNQSRNPGQFTQGTYNIRYTATDGSNNVAECTFTVTVNQGADTTPPVFTSCPQDFTQSIPFGSTFVAVNWNMPTATDNSGSPPNIVNQSRNPGQFTLGTYNIRYTATDGSNNVAECTFTVTVNQGADTTPPVFTSCPQDFTQSIPFGSAFVAVNWNMPTATDNSGSPPNIVNQSRNPGQFTQGTYNIRYTATDGSNNVAECTFTVTVNQEADTTPPVFTSCPQDFTQDIPIGSTFVTVNWITPTATDNSGSLPNIVNQSRNPGQFTQGIYNIRYTATDAANNVAECTFTVTINQQVDTVPPTFMRCPEDINQPFQVDGITTSAVVNWLSPLATDTSGGTVQIIQTLGPQSGSSFTIGQTTTIEYQATDPTGNSATCSFRVTVVPVDTIDPVFTSCPQDITQDIPFGSTIVTVNWNTPTATDSSGSQPNVVNQSRNPGQFTQGIYNIRYTATDGSNNVAECTFTVTINQQADTTPPVFTSCPEDFTQSIPIGSTFVIVDWNMPTATDNSGSPPNIVNQSRNPGQFTQGTYNIRYTATDGSNNVAECTFTITVTQEADNIAPMFTRCPDNIAQPFEIDGITTSAVVNWLPPLATDNSGGTVQIIQTLGPQSGSLFTIGQTTIITYQATDPTGNTATCSFSVRVVPVDTAAPVFTSCPRDITQSIPIGSTFVTVNWNLPTATDNSGSPPSIVNQSRNPGQFTQGTYNIRYTATDGSNNVAECTFTLTINQQADNIAPMFTRCPDNIAQPFEIDGITTSAVVNWLPPLATDNSGGTVQIIQTLGPQSGSLFTIGETTTITYQATDPTGNTATCSFSVRVVPVDTAVPVFTSCPQDITQDIPFGSTFVTVNWITPTATDSSGSQPNIVNQSRNPGQFTQGTYNIRYTATDGSNNVAECTFTVTVNQLLDTTPPVFTSCPQDFTQTIPFGSTFVAVNWNTPTATDNSGSPPNIVNQSRNPGQFTQGTYNIRYTATDGSNNVAECTFTVTVNQGADTTPPVFTSCPQDFTQTIPFGSTFVAVNWNTPTATDNSGSQPNIVNQSRNPGQFTLGTYNIRYTATDAANNVAECTFTVTVIQGADTTPPVFTSCPQDFTQTIPFGSTFVTVNWITPTATDNSGSPPNIVNQSRNPGQFTQGIYNIRYTATDAANNVAECTFTLTIIQQVDNIPPVITCVNLADQPVITEGSVGRSVTWSVPTASDNSGINPTIELFPSTQPPPGNFFLLGSYSITYRATDAAGNTATCDVTFNVVDRVDPQFINCPTDIVQQANFNQNSVPVGWPLPIQANDNAPGNVAVQQTEGLASGSNFPTGQTTRVTYTATDEAGNVATCSFTVTIVEQVDNIPPVITCVNLADQPVITEGSVGRSVTWSVPTASDNSGINPTIELFPSTQPPPGNFFLLGSYSITYRATDAAGNTATCDVTFNVVDRVDPQFINCPTDIVQQANFNQNSVPVGWPLPIQANDNAPGNVAVQQTEGLASGSNFPTGQTTRVTYTATDEAGNVATCSFTVTIVEQDDSEPPQFVFCPSDTVQQFEVDGTTNGVTITWQAPRATDNSGNVQINQVSGFPSGSEFPSGQTVTVEFRATDNAGNLATCSFTVTVNAVDTTNPVFTSCPQDVRQTIPLGSTSVVVPWTPPEATDTSGIAPTIVNLSQDPGSFSQGRYVITYRATDSAGNFAICTFEVIITQEVDTIPPEILFCPVNINQEIPSGVSTTTVTWSQPVATDNSGQQPTVQSSHTSGSTFSVGTTTVTYTFTDAAGNSNVCRFDVSITSVDRTPPEILFCPPDISRTILRGTGPIVVTWQEPTATDNSGVAPTISNSHNSGDSFSATVSTSVTYTFSDAVGNSVICTFTISITEVNLCDTQQCQNGGMCLADSLQTIRCLCSACYSGDLCQIAADACQTNQCQNGAQCVRNAGSCTQYECQCTSCFSGRFCTEGVDSCINNQCNNGATCTVNNNNCLEYICNCPPCFEGQFCEIPISPCQNHNCANGGVCRPVISNSDFSCTEYVCECPPCFIGEFCTQPRDACQPNPCRNGGQCTTLPDSCFSYTCQCSGCFTGYNCDIAVSSPCQTNPCLNGGECNVVVGTCTTYTCRCPAGFNGVICENVVTVNPNPCNSFPCQNGGNCLTMDGTYYICLCNGQFVGQNCQFSTASTPAAINACLASPCQNGAVCVNSYHSNSNILFGNTQAYSCTCANGFSGANCALPTVVDQTLNICQLGSKPVCQQGASCSNMYHRFDGDIDYFCNCPNGWTGHNCELQEQNPCSSAPCQNGGQCQTFQNLFNCNCPQGFTGVRCENPLVDIQPPIISGCPVPISRTTSNSNGQSVFWNPPTANDNSGFTTIAYQSHNPGFFFPVGTTLVTYIYRDNSFNFATCQFLVILTSSRTDTTAPFITGCPFGPTVNAVPGATSATATWVEPTATDNSGQQPQRTRSHIPGSTFSLGYTAVVYAFQDAAGNRATCSFLVNVVGTGVVDTTAPVISGCDAAATSRTIPSSASSIQVFWTEPTATDNSGQQVSTARTHLPGDSFTVGVTTVTYTFTDNSGNRATCMFSISVQRQGTGAVSINGCPAQEVTSTAPAGATRDTVFWIEPTARDEFGQTITNIQRSHIPGSQFNVGQSTQVTYTFTSNAGGQAQCIFTVTVNGQGTGAVSINGCPAQEVTSTAPAGATRGSVFWTEPTATDSFGQTVTNIQRSHVPGSQFNVGQPTQVTYTFTSNAGAQAQCIFTVTVNAVSFDNIAPVITVPCPNGVVVSAPSGASTFTVTWTPPSATDNSGSVDTFTSHEPGSSFIVGIPTTVTYRFTDPSGNFASCSFVVIVNTVSFDNIAPVITVPCPNGVVVSAPSGASTFTVTWTPPSATDNSGSVDTFTSHEPGSSFIVGIPTTVTYRFTDPSGNFASCSFVVIVNRGVTDNTPPTFTGCPSDIVVTAPTGSTSTTAIWTEPIGSDNSGAVPQVFRSHVPGTSFEIGSTTVTYRFVDGSNNEATCSFIVTVGTGTVDNMSPVLSNCPTGVTVYVPAGVTSTRVTWTPPTATDNSGVPPTLDSNPPVNSLFQLGMTMVTYSATDAVGNRATCDFGVNVIVDTMAPVISNCPAAAVEATLPSSTATSVSVSFTPPTATDNSLLPVTSNRTHVPGDGFSQGTTTVTYTFADSVNNVATCSFMVVVSAFTTERTPCDSNPCPANQNCFYTSTSYLCRDMRRRRDAGDEQQDDSEEIEECPCLNGGECVHSSGGHSGSHCICPSGFDGVLCDEVVNDVCNPNPCANNGSCVTPVSDNLMQLHHYICFCAVGWSGPNCLQDVGDEFTQTRDLKVRSSVIKPEVFIGVLASLLVVLFLIFSIAMLRIIVHQRPPPMKQDDKVAIVH